MRTHAGRTYVFDKGKNVPLKNGTIPFPDKKKQTYKLSPQDYDVVSKYIAGTRVEDIAQGLDVSETRIYNILKKPNVSMVIDQHYEKHVHQGMKAMAKMAVDNMRDGLSSENADLKFDYTKLYFQTRLAYEKDNPVQAIEQDSAESIIQRMMNLQINVNVNTGSPGNDTKLITTEFGQMPNEDELNQIDEDSEIEEDRKSFQTELPLTINTERHQ